MIGGKSPTAGVRVANRYALLSQLAGWGAGDVWLASDSREDGAPVAIKFLPALTSAGEDVRADFRATAAMLTKLRHTNIGATISGGIHGQQPFFVLQYQEGESLAAYLGRHARAHTVPALALSWHLFEQVCLAVRSAHGAHVPGAVLHASLSPDCIQLERMDSGWFQVRVIDFAIRKYVPELQRSHGLAIAPELQGAPDDALRATDVFALAALLIELLDPSARARLDVSQCLRGLSPSQSAEARRVLATLRPDVPVGVTDLLPRALQKLPELRYPDAGKFYDALKPAAWPPTPEGSGSRAAATGTFASVDAPDSRGKSLPPTAVEGSNDTAPIGVYSPSPGSHEGEGKKRSSEKKRRTSVPPTQVVEVTKPEIESFEDDPPTMTETPAIRVVSPPAATVDTASEDLSDIPTAAHRIPPPEVESTQTISAPKAWTDPELAPDDASNRAEQSLPADPRFSPTFVSSVKALETAARGADAFSALEWAFERAGSDAERNRTLARVRGLKTDRARWEEASRVMQRLARAIAGGGVAMQNSICGPASVKSRETN